MNPSRVYIILHVRSVHKIAVGSILEQTKTSEFKNLYRSRAKIERKVAHVMNRGMRKSRYIGREKTLIQLAYKAAGVNLKRIFQCTKGDVSKFDSLTKAMGI
ncbi:transposase [Sporomusa carbonis]|uniref:transposase n=1 Tax=Sporomusa carbonis TaxID=3076075 RepID=UPI003C7CDA88